MKIAIIGVGGVGGYFGAKLAQSGNDVTFVARGSHLSALKNSGLVIKSFLGDIALKKLNVVERITNIESPDLIILGVKAWQIVEIRNDLKKILNRNTMILPLQNGVLAVEELSEVIQRSNIIGGLCRIISKIDSPGVINHIGVNPSITMGELDKLGSHRIRELKLQFEKAGIVTKISRDIECDLWKKFIAICVSGLLAVTKTTYGELRELKETRLMMIDLLMEIFKLSQKLGISIESSIISETVSFIDTLPYNSTSSLTRDVWEGRPSEIDYQNGTVVSLGEKHRIETPINKFIYHSILPMELKARGLL